MNKPDSSVFSGRKTAAHRAKPGASARRRASVLILVMAVLGVLFVTGVAFMATMNWQARMVEREQQSRAYELGVAQIQSVIHNVLREQFMYAPGRVTPADQLTDIVTIIPPPGTQPYEAFRAKSPSFNTGYGVSPLVAPLEPQYPNNPYNAANEHPTDWDEWFMFRRFTDLEVLINGPQHEWYLRAVRPLDLSGAQYGWSGNLGNRRVDADGDGIDDSWEIDLQSIGVTGDAIRELAKVVNPSDNPTGRVRVGLRIVPHGAFVNLNHAHPSLINAVFDDTRWVARTPDERKNFPYSPDIEEPSLRHRNLLPPYRVPQSGVQGSTLLDPNLDPLGDGDFSSQMFTVPNVHFPNGESVFEGQHRYWPFRANEPPDPNLDLEYRPFAALLDRTNVNYDRRSLVTTISHDDLLARGAMWNDQDVSSLMRQVNQLVPQGPNCNPPYDPPFEYPDYPHTIANGHSVLNQACLCPTDPNCQFDPRKGRLQLSLPWLESGLLEAFPGPANAAFRNRTRRLLVHDVFTMLLLRARSPEFGEYRDPTPAGSPERPWYRTDSKNLPPGAQPVNLVPALERAAASLTANLLDYADADDVPTAIAIRNTDFSQINANGQNIGRPHAYPGTIPVEAYMFGLERQPFITELVSEVKDVVAPMDVADNNSFYAIELYNPYTVDLPLNGYSFRIWDGNDGSLTQFSLTNAIIPAGGFTVFYSGSPNGFSLPTNAIAISGGMRIPRGKAGANSNVYLVRTIQVVNYGDVPQTFEVAVDQYELNENCNTGKLYQGQVAPVWSTQRVLRAGFPWTAPVPIAPEDNEHQGPSGQTLGSYNHVKSGLAIPKPVHVDFANIVDFSNAADEMHRAFPTTGSLLLLMRHANRAWAPNLSGQKLAWTAFLDKPASIENGRLPVFDAEFDDSFRPQTNPRLANNPAWPHYRPGELYHLPWGQLIFDYFTALPLYNKGPFEDVDPNVGLDPAAQPKVDLDGLRVHGRMNIDAAPWKALEGVPKVPANRLADLPPALRQKIIDFAQLNPTDSRPIGPELAKAIVAYREAREICKALPGQSGQSCGDTTGDYGDYTCVHPITGQTTTCGRGNDINDPTFRRGRGFLTVGELANVRHPNAREVQGAIPAAYQFNDFSPYRIDAGVLDWDPTYPNPTTPSIDYFQDYVAAVANLVAIGDWLTVKSHVFTVYASIRGEALNNPQSQTERDDRALRLQETVDRLPMFLGQPSPTRIGERSLGLYKDLQSN